jgi:hypothetical protein
VLAWFDLQKDLPTKQNITQGQVGIMGEKEHSIEIITHGYT